MLTVLALVVSLLATPFSGKDTPTSQPARAAILRRAKVYQAPPNPIEQADLGRNPAGPGAFRETDVVRCRFEPKRVGGKTPKFDCRDESGAVIRVRYGRDNPEVFTQVAASRLMSAIGFPADRVYVVARVECAGCPADPFHDLQCLEKGSVASCFPNVDTSQSRSFDTAVVERAIEGRRIETTRGEGWSWPELDTIDSRAGGSRREEIDALRLMAMFLADWDTKPENQRLLCVDAPEHDAACDHPVAMIKDLGATFGPVKLDVNRWRSAPIWADATRCVLSMRALPYGGSNFGHPVVTEAGRQLLAGALQRLSAGQLRDLFVGARFEQYSGGTAADRDIDAWVQAFQARATRIAAHPACRQSRPARE